MKEKQFALFVLRWWPGADIRPGMRFGSPPQAAALRHSTGVEITGSQGQDACWILPSEDQPADMNGQAALIVRYPEPVRIGGDIYHYFIQGLCDAHPRQQHLEQITSG